MLPPPIKDPANAASHHRACAIAWQERSPARARDYAFACQRQCRNARMGAVRSPARGEAGRSRDSSTAIAAQARAARVTHGRWASVTCEGADVGEAVIVALHSFATRGTSVGFDRTSGRLLPHAPRLG